MRMPVPFLLLPAALVGCAPHDGDVTGDWLVYFAEGSSLNLGDIEDGRRIDLAQQDNLDRFGFTPIDCRDLAEDEEGQRLPLADTSACGDTEWFWWFQSYAFYKMEGKIEPYRVEALLTTEHDLQLTLHMNVPRIGDMRVGWVVDPRFQPTECEEQEDGTAVLEDVDGDWLENWSADEDGGTLFNLNAGSYQINPTEEEYWVLEQDWLGGYAFGRFEDDDFYGHSTDYIDQDGNPLYLWSYDQQAASPQVGNLPQSNFDYESWVGRMREAFDEPTDLATMGQASFDVDIKVEDNSWRLSEDEVQAESNATAAYGLENWIGINTSWVKLDISPDEVAALEAGNQDTPLTGSFLVSLDGLSSASKFFVQGTFSLDHISRDVWDYSPTLDEIKREENNTPECGEERLTTDD